MNSAPEDRGGSTPSRDEALAALQAADSARLVTSSDRRRLVGFTATLGLLVGVILALAWWTLSTHNVPGFAASFTGYALVLYVLVAIQRRANATPRGFKRLYQVGLTTTMILYAVGVLWFSSRPADPVPAALFLPYCAVVSLPCLVAAVLIDRRARR